MATVKPTTAPSKASHDAAEAGHGLHHHHHRLLHRRHHHKAQPSPPPAAPVNRCDNSSGDINDCADAFIKHFRQQLELQRLQSIENYQEMLARGL